MVYPCRVDVSGCAAASKSVVGICFWSPRLSRGFCAGSRRVFEERVCGHTPSLGDDYDLDMALFSLSGQRVRVVIEALE